MMLALHIVMTRRVDAASPLNAAHQPRPVEIEAALFGMGMIELGRMRALIRPEGWTVPAGYSQAQAERYGCRAVAPMPLLTDWNEAAGTVLAHDVAATELSVRCWRAALGKGEGGWLRPGQAVLDTAADAAELMGLERGAPTVEDATEALVGRRMSGLAGVLALNASTGMQAMRRAA